MANIVFNRSVQLVDGSIKNSGDSLSTTMAIAKKYIGDGSADWQTPTVKANLPDNPGRITVLDNVSALAGGAVLGMDGFLLGPIAVGRLFQVIIGSEGPPRTYRVITVNGEVADGDNFISPPDYDATANNKFLARVL
jgi:hypothetical protein